MTDREIAQAAALVRATPIRRTTGHRIHTRPSVPPSVAYGARWRSLPVEGTGDRDNVALAFVSGLGLVSGVCCLMWMLARLIGAAL